MTQTGYPGPNPDGSRPGRGRPGWRWSAMGVTVTRPVARLWHRPGPVLRWLVPGGLVAAMAAIGALTAALQPDTAALPDRTPAEILVDLASPQATGVSGTVVERADLGLPALPNGIGGDGRADFTTL